MTAAPFVQEYDLAEDEKAFLIAIPAGWRVASVISTDQAVICDTKTGELLMNTFQEDSEAIRVVFRRIMDLPVDTVRNTRGARIWKPEV